MDDSHQADDRREPLLAADALEDGDRAGDQRTSHAGDGPSSCLLTLSPALAALLCGVGAAEGRSARVCYPRALARTPFPSPAPPRLELCRRSGRRQQ